MRGRKLRSGTLVALVGALILVLGAAPSLAQRKGIHSTDPLPKRFENPHKVNQVTVFFDEVLVEEGTQGKEVGISVTDECGRRLEGTDVQRVTAEDNEWVEKATVQLDRRKKNPHGQYSVVVSYWLASDEVENPEDPNEPDPPAPEARIYEYWFNVHGGPNCDGSDRPGPGDGDGDGNGDGGGGKNQVWGNTSGSGHDSDGGHMGHENLLSASGSTTGQSTDHTTPQDFSPFTSPMITSGLNDYSGDHRAGPTTPFGEDDFGDPFGDTTGTSPLSDPTDPSLYESEVGQVPEEAEDQQTLSAAPADDVEPEASTLVVALALALLLGVGGGLFLRKTDPAPIRR